MKKELAGDVYHTEYNGKPYVLLSASIGSWLFTKSQWDKIQKETHKTHHNGNYTSIIVSNTLASEAYYKFQNFISEHPSFLKKVSKVMRGKPE